MEQLEEQGEWEQTWGEHQNRSKRRREWDRGGWELWEMKEEAAVTNVRAVGRINEMGDVPDVSVGEENVTNEGMRDVGETGVDVKGDGGRKKEVKLAASKQPTKRIPLRGRRRGGKERKAKEDEVLALQMEQWLVSKPPSNQNY